MGLLTGRALIGGQATGPLLTFEAPISFWGGVDPATGIVCDPRHPQHGEKLAERVIALPDTVGSSSSSAIMLELMRNGTAPAGVIVRSPDAILVLGVVVGSELGYATVPVVELGDEFSDLPAAGQVEISADLVGWA